MQIDACIFDLDGVIVDTADFHFIAWQKLARALGSDLSEEQNELLKGVSRRGSLERILKWAGKELTEEEIQHWMAVKNNWYLDMVSGMGPDDVLPGARSFVERLRTKGYKTAIGSSSKNTPGILKLVEMDDQFDAIVDGSMVKKGKPNPETFLLGAELMHVLPANTIVFEDALSGIKAAKAGGFVVIGVGDSPQLEGADLIIDSLKEIRIEEIRKQLDQLASKV
ncbi:MAG: beta-phosphoglucomutase [Saprospiraceae bacterium]|nr:beta-phosphoglucomutase [Saprospiraceae bacterium]